jgi:hypothetical protein
MTATSTTELDEIARLIKENAPKSKVQYGCVERMLIECTTKDSDDVVVELMREGFAVKKRHPMIKSAMKLNMNRIVIDAEREVE